MTKGKPLRERSKDGSIHVTDEFYNTLISATAALFSLVGVIYLIYQSSSADKFWHVVSFSAYGFGILSVFISSALHHGVNSTEKVEHFLRQLDYFAISIMIAGTFTPFCLILLRESIGWKVFYTIWALAILGIVIYAFFPKVPKWITTGLFLLMGWLGVMIAQPVYIILHWEGVSWLVYGGIVYTVGALIYFFEKPNPFPGRFGFHEIWHLFVVGGAACHFYPMLVYLLPY